jgi:hemolysin activation/secretion protein
MKLNLTILLSAFSALSADLTVLDHLSEISLECPTPIHGIKLDCTAQPEEVSGPVATEVRGIALVGNSGLIRPSSQTTEGVSSVKVNLIDGDTQFMRSLDRQFVGQPLTKETIQAIKQTVADHYSKSNQPFAVVNVPRQEITNGVVQVVVTEARLGEVRFKGNEHFSNGQLQSYIRTKPGHPIDAKEIREDMAFMNQNPFRRTDAVFVPGQSLGLTDLELLTVDQWPYRIYAGADNTGTIATDRNRIFFGFNLGKTNVKDSEVSFQYTQAPDTDRFYSLAGLVRVPIPYFRHTLQAFGGYTAVKPQSGLDDLRPEGKAWSVDLRYRIPIFETGAKFLQSLVFGYDFKESNTDLIFGGSSDYYGLADINQFMIGYDLGASTKMRKVSLTAELFISPSSITKHNNSHSFKTLRDGANATYAYLKVTQSLAQQWNGWKLSYDFTGQVASTNLLPSEQLSMTGYHAVRGFEERILDLDDGGILNVTVETPRFSPARLLGAKKTYDELYLLAFFDMGMGCNHTLTPGEKRLNSLGSIGPGIRYEFGRYCSAHLDYGFQLWHNGFDTVTDSRYNFGVALSY